VLYLVRHAKAGSRASWHDEDELRPLSKTGRSQAARLDKWLAKAELSRVLSSPYVRCTQTVEPAAKRHGLKVEPLADLAEGEDPSAVVDLLEGLPDHAVLCSHGDIVTGAIEELVRRGLDIVGKPDFSKGSLWELRREDGRWLEGRARPPR
jgi:8-oxo-dGTP diphosphatase